MSSTLRPACAIPAGIVLPLMLTACSGQLSPTQPSTVTPALPASFTIEAEGGTGDGVLRERSRASQGRTVHLAPGEKRSWTFRVIADSTPYVLAVTYSNGQEGPNETLHVSVDGTPVATFLNRDSGDAIDGWNLFVTDPAGESTLGPGSHTLTLESSGGDGCVEIDLFTVKAASSSK